MEMLMANWSWATWNTIIGAFLPLLIEFVANKLSGWKKLLAALGITVIVSIIKVGSEGNLNFSNVDYIFGTLIVILTASQVFWRTTWAHLFK
jgi:hypothetical protein